MYLIFEYYSNNSLFVFVFGHNSEPEYFSYSFSAKYLCTNIIRILIHSFWKNEYYSYLYLVKILIPNNIRISIRPKKQYSLTSGLRGRHIKIEIRKWIENKKLERTDSCFSFSLKLDRALGQATQSWEGDALKYQSQLLSTTPTLPVSYTRTYNTNTNTNPNTNKIHILYKSTTSLTHTKHRNIEI